MWKTRLGPRYYHFIYRDVLFLVLDTEDNTPERMAHIEQACLEAVNIYKIEGPEAFAKTEYARMPERTSGTVGSEQSAYFQKTFANLRMDGILDKTGHIPIEGDRLKFEPSKE